MKKIKKNIPNPLSKLINYFVIFTLLLTVISAQAMNYSSLQNSFGQKISLRLAISREDQTKGLSGLKPHEFKDNEGMLFINDKVGPRKFWMPDTYFALDIYFLDQNLTIVGLERNVPFHPGSSEPPEIYRTNVYESQFVLETKPNILFGKKIKVGDKLKFSGPISLSEIIRGIHPKQ